MRYTTTIVKGKGRGQRVVGFPTFNLKIPETFDLPHGVYACTVWFDNKQYAGALHYGPTPTFDDQAPTLEIFVLDYAPAPKDERPSELIFEPGLRLRPVATFLSASQLHDQIENDIQRIRRSAATPAY